jgi:pimeloyl-ACP methyl ester carboxylesterase
VCYTKCVGEGSLLRAEDSLGVGARYRIKNSPTGGAAHSVARVIANAGHMTMIEAAKAVNDSIQELAAPLA